jgi:hypothetical protein
MKEYIMNLKKSYIPNAELWAQLKTLLINKEKGIDVETCDYRIEQLTKALQN